MDESRVRSILGLTSLFISVLLALVPAGVANADTLYACKLNITGTIRIVTATTTCTQYETKISWSTVGPAGPQGPSGVSLLFGDVSGQATSNTVAALRGIPIAPLPPTEGQVLVYTAGSWRPATGGVPAKCLATANPRIFDCQDGTVIDAQTGLMWEQKVTCGAQDLSNPNCMENLYTWSAAGIAPDGTLYSDFLEGMNDLKTPNDGTATPCFANHCDWRIPTIGELRSILLAPYPTCSSTPCIDVSFGPTQTGGYWSDSSLAGNPATVWGVVFGNGGVSVGGGNGFGYARAVRGGR
jgi:hypothetical protein